MKRKIFEALTVLMTAGLLVVGTGQTRTSDTDISEPIVETVTEDKETIKIKVPSLTYSAGVGRDLYMMTQLTSIEMNDIPIVASSGEKSNEETKEEMQASESEEKRSDEPNQVEQTTASDSTTINKLGNSVRKSEVKSNESNSTTTGNSKIPSSAFRVSSTAYYNPNGNRTADGSRTIAGLTLAGKREWLGRSCKLFTKDGRCMGTYEFHDTGWGIDGDILRGETVDIYFDTYDECIQYGRRDIYVDFID